ncbi:MAG: preprotein translocase subunit SecG [Candidatus Eremiobacteraeota bacterium]|nr:preprotein translocase subunit SecG [Candidatus Eremiobacteraeota bacterium]
MSVIIFALLAATPAAAVPTPLPLSTLAPAPAGYTFHQATIADNYPWVLTLVQILFLVATVALIALMSVQTTKTEGLSGTIGGRTELAYKGRLGLDQQITRVTQFAAYSWFVLAVVFFWVTR